MASVGYATLQIIPSLRGLEGSLTKGTAAPMTAAGKTGGRRFGSAILGVAKSIAGPIAAAFAGSAVYNFGKQAVMSAATVQTAQKVTDRAFGGSAKAIKAWAADSSQSYAFTEGEALKMGNNLGFVASQAGGLAGKQLANFTQNALNVAQALSVVNDVPVEQTMGAIQSAVAGNTESLRDLGYNIDETILKEKGLSMGAKLVDGELTQQARSLALNKLIMEQSQGPLENLASGQGDLTAQSKLAARQWDDLKTTLGAALLPVVTAAAKAFNNWLPAIQGFFTALLSGKGAVSGFGESMGSVFAAIGAVVGPALRQIWNLILTQLIPAFRQFLVAAQPIARWLMTVLGPVVAAIFGGIVLFIKGALNVITGILKVFTGLFTGNWKKVWNGVKQIFLGAWQLLQAWALKKIAIVGKVILRGLGLIRKGFGSALSWIRGRWNAAWTWVGKFARSVWNKIWGWIRGFIGNIRSGIGSFLSSIRSRWNSTWSGVGNFLRNAWQRIVGAVRNGIRRVVGFFRDLPGRIKSGLGNVGNLLRSAGRDVIEGLIRGIRDMGNRAVDAARGVVDDAIQGAKSLLGIASPSKVFRSFGQYMSEGMALGIEDNAGMVAKAANAMASPDMSFGGASFGSSGGFGAGARGMNVQHMEVKAYTDRFSLRQVQDELALHSVM